MKQSLILIFLLTMACGKHELLPNMYEDTKKVGEDGLQIAEGVVNMPKEIIGEILGTNKRLDNLEDNVSELDKLVKNKLMVLNAQISVLKGSNKEFAVGLEFAIQTLHAQDISLVERNEELTDLSNIVTDFLNGYATLLDPCGDSPHFDEVLIKLYTGEVLAVFQDRKYFMSVLEYDKVYTTTDKQKCKFKIVDGELVNL